MAMSLPTMPSELGYGALDIGEAIAEVPQRHRETMDLKTPYSEASMLLLSHVHLEQ